jgi:catechol 2,3-dioxygenase-like lactoylglutathione lyase family enzyme
MSRTNGDPNFVILYVDNPPASARFYGELLGKQPVEASPTFAMFALDSGVMLGLWSRHTVEPAATPGAAGGELCFAVGDDAAVRAAYADWGKRGLRVAQTPVALDFGFTFVALDPDGHRLRVFAPAAAAA